MALTTLLGVGLGLSAVGTAGSIAANVLQSKSNNRTQFEQNQALMEQQSELNQKNWESQFNMTNEYNSPEAQMKRLQQAGINPLFSDSAGVSSASPSGGTASLPSVSAPEHVDYAGSVNSMLQNIMQMFALRSQTNLNESQEHKNNAEAEATGKHVVNETNMTNSQLAVNAAKCLELASQTDLNKEQRDFLVQQTAASKEQVRQKWQELEIASQSVGVKLREVINQEYTSRWQEEVGRVNARSNAVQAQASASQAQTAADTLSFAQRKWTDEFKIQVAKFSKECTNENIDNFIKLAKESGFSIGGTNFTKQKWIAEQSAICEAFVNNMDKLDEKSFNKALPYFLKCFSEVQSVEFIPPVKPKKSNSYNPAPWFPDEM